MRDKRAWLIAAAVVLWVVVLGVNRDSGEPLDPDSTQPLGTRALVEVLEDLGADVRVGSGLADRSGSAVLFAPPAPWMVGEIRTWVRAGGVLVQPWPGDPLGLGLETTTARVFDDVDQCDIDLLGQARPPWRFEFRTAVDGRPACFSNGQAAFVVESALGAGRVLTVGGAEWMTNSALDEGDNAALAVWMLAPEPDEATVSVLYRPRSDSAADGLGEDIGLGVSSRSLSELIPRALRNAIWLALASLGLWAIARSARLGKVVPEPLPVPIRSSELVLQAGNLWRRSRDPGGAAEVIRAEAAARWGRRLDAPPERLAGALLAHPEIDQAAVAGALSEPVDSNEDLVEFVADIQRIDQVLQAPAGRPPAATTTTTTTTTTASSSSSSSATTPATTTASSHPTPTGEKD